MDYLKTSAPFWKKETRTDGSISWVDAKASDDAAAERWMHAEKPTR
jgi:molybdopterin synthase catalytic subunit